MSQTFAQLINGKSATVEFSTGSASTPSVAFSGDTNTGIYSPGADQVAISTGGSGRLFVDASGRIGVGTSSPSELLHLLSSGNVTARVATSDTSGTSVGRFRAVYTGGGGGTTSAVDLRAGDGYGYLLAESNVPLLFGTNNTERLRITSAGLVGVGTSSPQSLLHLSNTTQQRFFCNGSQNSIAFWKDSTPTFAAEVGIGGATGLTSTMKFDIYNGSAWNTAMTIDSSSRVGIGTTAPNCPFVVAGGSGLVSNFTNQSDADFNINCTSGVTTIGPQTGVLALKSSNTERARIDSSGRLLVGTSSARANFYNGSDSGQIQLEGTTYQNTTSALICNSSTTGNTGTFLFAKSAGTSIGSNTAVTSGHTLGVLSFQGNDGSEFVEAASIIAQVDATPGANDMPGRLVFSTTADGASSPTERMRITNSGFLKASSTGGYGNATGGYHELRQGGAGNEIIVMAHTGSSSPYGINLAFTGASPNDTTSYFLYCGDSTAQRATIRSNGGLANYSANNANLSDRNAKKDITPASGTWNCIKEWEIVNYRYKDQPDDADLNLGVIAQQVAESCPEVITVFQEAKEATADQPAQEERLGVKEQQMYWMAIKALQEAQARIEQLEAEMAEVKAQLS